MGFFKRTFEAAVDGLFGMEKCATHGDYLVSEWTLCPKANPAFVRTTGKERTRWVRDDGYDTSCTEYEILYCAVCLGSIQREKAEREAREHSEAMERTRLIGFYSMCQKCGARKQSSGGFCVECGHKIQSTPHTCKCGHKFPAARLTKFCGGCGAPTRA